MTKKKYTLEEIMKAWMKYCEPIYYFNGKEQKKEEWDSIFGKRHIMENSSTRLEIIDRYNNLKHSFPEYLVSLEDTK